MVMATLTAMVAAVAGITRMAARSRVSTATPLSPPAGASSSAPGTTLDRLRRSCRTEGPLRRMASSAPRPNSRPASGAGKPRTIRQPAA